MRRAAFVAMLLAVGCAGQVAPPAYPVDGTLLVNGQPAANASVAFHPRDGEAVLVATTAVDGTFRLTTATPGDYAVTVVWPDLTVPQDECAAPTAHDRLKARYADPATTPLRVTVRPEPNRVPLQVLVTGSWSAPRMRDVQQ